jgi:hypothetical protein
MTDSTDDVDWYDGYMDTPKPRKTKPLSGTYCKFKHLDRVLRDCAASTDPVHRAAAEMWAAIAEANSAITSTHPEGSHAKPEPH